LDSTRLEPKTVLNKKGGNCWTGHATWRPGETERALGVWRGEEPVAGPLGPWLERSSGPELRCVSKHGAALRWAARRRAAARARRVGGWTPNGGLGDALESHALRTEKTP